MKRLLQLLLSALLLVSTTLHAEHSKPHIPKNFSAQFELYKSGFPIADTQYHFSNNNNIAIFTHISEPGGLTSFFSSNRIEEQSILDTTDNTLKVKSYHYKQTGDKKMQISSVFNWSNKTLSTTKNKQTTVSQTFEPPVWDKLSSLLGLMSSAQDQSKDIYLPTLDDIDIKKYRLKYIGKKEIETDEDEWITSHIWRREDNNKAVIFYLDPNNHYFPVMIEQYKSQKLRATLLLKELKWL